MTLSLVPCPLCGSDVRLSLTISTEDSHIRGYGDLYAGRDTSEWKACGRCGFVHQNPRPTIATLNAFYENGQYHAPVPHDPETLMWQCRNDYSDNVEFVLRWTGLSGGTVLDLGCGYGFALREFERRGWVGYGVEPDPGRVEFAHQHLGLTRVRRGLVDAHLGRVIPQPIDLVISHHAFEHFADLHAIMTALQQVTKPGGYVFARIPTYRRNRSRMSILYMNAAHYSMFTDRSMSQLFARYGFEHVSHTYLRKAGREVTDDLMYLGRNTGVRQDPERFFESPRAVQRYVNWTNPLRSWVFAPVYSVGYKKLARVMRVSEIEHLLTHPRDVAKQVIQRVARMIGSHSLSTQQKPAAAGDQKR